MGKDKNRDGGETMKSRIIDNGDDPDLVEIFMSRECFDRAISLALDEFGLSQSDILSISLTGNQTLIRIALREKANG